MVSCFIPLVITFFLGCHGNNVFLSSPEFGPESECLLQETQPELQQYFLQYGYDLFFVDLNLNYDHDPFVDPYAFQCMLSEIEEASKCSDAIFFLVSFVYQHISSLRFASADLLSTRLVT